MKKLVEEINVNFKDTEPCVQEVEVEISAEAINRAIERLAKEIAQYAEIQGFRKGRAPVALIKKRYLPIILKDMEENISNAIMQKVTQEAEAELLTMPVPTAEPMALKEDTDYTITLTMNVAPDFKLLDYKSLDLEIEKATVTDEEIEESIDKLREHYSEYVTVDDEAKEGDMLKVSYTSDIELPEDAPDTAKRYIEAEKSWIWLSEPEMFPGIIKLLSGVKAGEEKEVEIEFGEDFTEPALSDLKGTYKFEIIEVQRRKPVESDEELVKKLMIENIDELKERIKEQIKQDKTMQQMQQLKKKVLELLAEVIEIKEYPPALLEAEIATQMQYLKNKNKDKEPEDEDQLKEEAAKLAEKSLKEYLVCRKIAAIEDIEVSDAEINQNIGYLSRMHNIPPQQLREILIRSGQLDNIYREILKSKVSDFIVQTAVEKTEDGEKEESDTE
jgi:trigger factor